MRDEIQGSPSPGDPTLAALRRGELTGVAELRLGAGIDSFPSEIFGLADTLEILDLGRGSLDTLPADLGRLHKLRVIFLSGHRFARLPPALGDCAALGQIGCRGTGLVEVPGEALPEPALAHRHRQPDRDPAQGSRRAPGVAEADARR